MYFDFVRIDRYCLSMKNLPKSTAAIWDMDGTLFDTERLALECGEEICNTDGYPNARDTLIKLIGRTAKDSDDIIRADFGQHVDTHELRQRKHVLIDERIERHGIPVKPGVRPTLHWLAERGIPSAVASSTHQATVLSHLEREKLLEFFQLVIGGDQIQRGKPHPEIFLTAAERLKVRPEHCVVFEDSYNGVIAAHEAGMRVVMIPDLIPPNAEILDRVHHTLRSLEDAIPLFTEIFSEK